MGSSRRCLSAFLLLLAALLSYAAAASPAHDPAPPPDDVRYRLKVPADEAQRDWLSAHDFDIAGHNLPQGWVEVITDDAGVSLLWRAGFEPELIERRDGARPLADTATEVPLADTLYTDDLELEAFLTQIVADHPAIVRREAIGTTHEGRTVWALLISDNAAVDEDELSILFSGAHHAREVMTPEVMIDTIDQLTDGYGVDPTITGLVDEYQIWCVPMVNPDGVARVFAVDDFWRKNLRDNDENGSINNQDGVDINRNYDWAFGGYCEGSSGAFSSTTYRGPYEGSEPEIQAMIRLARRIRPVFDVEYHTYGEDVFYAMGCDPAMHNPTLSTISGSDKSISRVVGRDYAALIEQADGQKGFTAAAFGSRVDGLGRDHQYHETGAIALVTEMNSLAEGGFLPDYATWRDATVTGQRPAWRWLIERIGGAAVGGHVVDAVTGLPVEADVSLDEMSLPDGKRLTSRADTGRFHIIVVPAAYTLRVNAPGYDEAVVDVTVGDVWQPTRVDLQPSGSTRVVRVDFEDPASAAGWSVGDPSDTATGGAWVFGEPFGTFRGSVQGGDLEHGAPGLDRTPGEGRMAVVTGNSQSFDFTSDDVDGGSTTLNSPSFDLSGLYAVELIRERWFQKEADPADSFDTQVSVDGGQTWVTLESLTQGTSTVAAPQAWAPGTTRLDDLVALGPDVRFRFRATDWPPDSMVEAAIDDVEIRGFSLLGQGEPVDVVLTETTGGTRVDWQPVAGAADAVYDVVRGDLTGLGGGGGAIDLGTLICVEDDSADHDTSSDLDAATPAPGKGWFYLVRFNLGFSLGGWGQGSDGSIRSGLAGCSP